MASRSETSERPAKRFKKYESDDVAVVKSFEEMGLKKRLLRGIYQYGFDKPSAIQQRAVKPITERRDTILQSQSGTGKTTILSISILQVINTKKTGNGCLALGEHLNAKVHSCIGGHSVGEDLRTLE